MNPPHYNNQDTHEIRAAATTPPILQSIPKQQTRLPGIQHLQRQQLRTHPPPQEYHRMTSNPQLPVIEHRYLPGFQQFQPAVATSYMPNIRQTDPHDDSKLTKRKSRPCEIEGCTRIAQTRKRCKSHGGGSRCRYEGCSKSNQGSGLCRAHGGGKRCKIDKCDKGAQRNGLCHSHGGVRYCKIENCDKKDRGIGYCVAHGGGKRCTMVDCNRLARKQSLCTQHMASA